MKRCTLLLFLLLIVAAGTAFYAQHMVYEAEKRQWTNACILLISKQEMKLRLIDYKGKELFTAPVATGIKEGNKTKMGDMKTPEGTFQVEDIQKASSWEHDFGDGNGKIKGAYGDYFIRLTVPGHKGIGIHGTHLPESIGNRASEGCIRMKNEDLNELVSRIYPPLIVVITPAVEDELVNNANRQE